MKKRSLIFGLVLSLLAAAMVLPGAAAVADKEIPVQYRNVKITLDGTRIIPRDVQGRAVEPFLSQGTTYLPIRGIASALGLGVSWNGQTQTVVLTTAARQSQAQATQPAARASYDTTLIAQYRNVKITLDGKRITPKDVQGRAVEPFLSQGTTYLPVRGIASALGLGVSWNGQTQTVVLTTGGSQDQVMDQVSKQTVWSHDYRAPAGSDSPGLYRTSIAFQEDGGCCGLFYTPESGYITRFKGTYQAKGTALTLTYQWDFLPGETYQARYEMAYQNGKLLLKDQGSTGITAMEDPQNPLQFYADREMSLSQLYRFVYDSWGQESQ